MKIDPIAGPGRSRRGRAVRRGYSLMEAIISLVLTSVVLAMGVPRCQISLEQSRASVAGANLRSIWSAQRLYWLEYRAYAPDLGTLQSANLVDPSLATSTAPYIYEVALSGDGTSFTATAARAGSSSWSGGFTIAADGSFSGSVQQAGQGTSIVPNFQ